MTKLGLLALASTAFAVPETSTLWPRTDGQRYAADDASVALCMVGHIRTMFHPATMGAHFAAFEHLTNLERFAVLSMSSDFHALTEADKSIKTRGAFDTLHAAGLRRYNFTSVYVMDDNHTFTSEFFRTGNCKEGGSCAGLERKVCRKGCASFSMIPLCDEAYMKSRASARETPENWVCHLDIIPFNFIIASISVVSVILYLMCLSLPHRPNKRGKSRNVPESLVAEKSGVGRSLNSSSKVGQTSSQWVAFQPLPFSIDLNFSCHGSRITGIYAHASYATQVSWLQHLNNYHVKQV